MNLPDPVPVEAVLNDAGRVAGFYVGEEREWVTLDAWAKRLAAPRVERFDSAEWRTDAPPPRPASRRQTDAEMVEEELRRERARRAALAKLDAEADAAQARADHAADRAAREALAPRHRVLTGSELHRLAMIREADPRAVRPVEVRPAAGATLFRQDAAERARGSAADFQRQMVRDEMARGRS